MIGSMAVAISTTGDPHRLAFLETCARMWWQALVVVGLPTRIYVTVDGDLDAVARAVEATAGFAEVTRVGQAVAGSARAQAARDGRLGVAVNKNTGLELLMGDVYQPEHLFLSDDDAWPLGQDSLRLHTDLGYGHSLVCWGKHRASEVLVDRERDIKYGSWTWPRGSVMYVSRSVVETVGGMLEAFGPGGHEHVEWSRRIHQAGFTPAPYVTPEIYNHLGALGMLRFWHAEDAPRRGEPLGNLRMRRRRITSIRRAPEDWSAIEQIMAAQDGNTGFVPYSAVLNGRRMSTAAIMTASTGVIGTDTDPRQGAE